MKAGVQTYLQCLGIGYKEAEISVWWSILDLLKLINSVWE